MNHNAAPITEEDEKELRALVTQSQYDFTDVAYVAKYTVALLATVDKLREENKVLEQRRQYGSDIINDMTLEAELAKRPILEYPEFVTVELEHVLGWPNFKCAPYAHAFRAVGHIIPAKAEREQAFVLHWLIKLVLKHGEQWAEVAQQELKALVPAAAQEGEKGE